MRLKNNIRADADADGGAVAVVVAVFAVVAFGFAAIVVDLGYARVVKARAQDAADSAALAAAAQLYSGGSASDAAAAAETNARNVLGLDGLDDEDWLDLWTDCDDPSRLPVPLPPIPEPSCVSFDVSEANDPRQVRVRVPDTPVESFFGGIFDYGGIDISAAATASIGPIEFTPACAICVLGAGPHVLDNGDVLAEGADISFNGNVDLLNESTVTAIGRTVFVEGEATKDLTSSFGEMPVKEEASPVDDPLNGEPAPNTPGLLGTNPCSEGPGVYDSPVLTGACALQPGTYRITGDLTATSGATIDGVDDDADNETGVQFWLAGGSIDLSDAEVVDLLAPAGSFLVYAPIGSSSVNLFGAANTISGHIYSPGGSITGGSSCTQGRINGWIVVSHLDVDDGCLVSERSTSQTTASTQPPVLIS